MHVCCYAGALVPVKTSVAAMYLPFCQLAPGPLTATSPWHTPVPDRGHDLWMTSLDPLLPLAAPGLPGRLSPGAGGGLGEAGCTAAAWRSGAAPGSAAEAARAAMMGRGAHRQDAGTGSLIKRRARGAGAAKGATQRVLAGVTPLASLPGAAPEAPPPSRAAPEAGLQTDPRPNAHPRPASAAGHPLHRLACCVASQPNPSAPFAPFSLSPEEGGSPAPDNAGAPAWSSQPAPSAAWQPPARAPLTQARGAAEAPDLSGSLDPAAATFPNTEPDELDAGAPPACTPEQDRSPGLDPGPEPPCAYGAALTQSPGVRCGGMASWLGRAESSPA
jgi:hypothetical protein